jgi:tryptophan synthase alpha chain
MGRITDTFKELRKHGRKALVTFITAGDPDLETTANMIRELAEAGADIVEIGVPFSDPMADGPTIQLSSERALASGTTLPSILGTISALRNDVSIPLILMGYYNPIFSYGAERFVTDAVNAGVDGIIIVDLPPEEADAEGFHAFARDKGLDLIYLLSPTSDQERINKVARKGRGFIYYVSVTGVTGARQDISLTLGNEVRQIRDATALPLVIGFGISDPAQAGDCARIGDGAVVGSALVKLFEQYKGTELVARVRESVSSLKLGIISAAENRETGA